MKNTETLVIILGETRGHELTFENFKMNVLNVLHADLCLCIGIHPSTYDYNNPFYQHSKYRFVYDEPDDYASAYDYAFKIISKNRCSREILLNINVLHGALT